MSGQCMFQRNGFARFTVYPKWDFHSHQDFSG
jgi:hypothetical protein